MGLLESGGGTSTERSAASEFGGKLKNRSTNKAFRSFRILRVRPVVCQSFFSASRYFRKVTRSSAWSLRSAGDLLSHMRVRVKPFPDSSQLSVWV